MTVWENDGFLLKLRLILLNLEPWTMSWIWMLAFNAFWSSKKPSDSKILPTISKVIFPLKIRWLGTERIPKFQSAMSLTASHSKFYRTLFVEIEALVSRWNGLQSESASYFATLATVSDRIRLLQEHSNDLGVLSTFENLSEQMVRTQYAGLESVMGTLKTA